MSKNIQSELDEVDELVRTVSAELDSPLRNVVSSQIELLPPYLRAWFVLSAGTHQGEADDVRAKRIYLAAALETLYLALNTHKHLLADGSPSEDNPQNRTFVGSIILAGDYCFSRSAEFAAQTENATVVSIFSEALTTVSEGHLRQLHDSSQQPFNDVQTLVDAGTKAALELCHLSTGQKEIIINLSQEIAAEVTKTSSPIPTSKLTDLGQTIDNLAIEQQLRWQGLIQTFVQ